MPEFRDADGVKWRVRRRWWSLWGLLDTVHISGNGTFGAVVFVLALPVLALWPVRIGLSATQRPIERVAEITAGLRELKDEQQPPVTATELNESGGVEAH